HKHQVGEVACGGTTQFLPLAQFGVMANSPEKLGTPDILVGDIFAHTEFMAAPVFDADTASEKTRPNLKVQDGCNNRCSFCIIPFVRGKSSTIKLYHVLSETRARVSSGYKEIVLSGINLGRWGRDFEGRTRFVDLLRAM